MPADLARGLLGTVNDLVDDVLDLDGDDGLLGGLLDLDGLLGDGLNLGGVGDLVEDLLGDFI